MKNDFVRGDSTAGRIVAVHGDVIDIEFKAQLPSINDAPEEAFFMVGELVGVS